MYLNRLGEKKPTPSQAKICAIRAATPSRVKSNIHAHIGASCDAHIVANSNATPSALFAATIVRH